MDMVQAAPSPETSPMASLTSYETEKQPKIETATTCHKASSTSKTPGLTYPLQAEGVPRNKREPTARPPATP